MGRITAADIRRRRRSVQQVRINCAPDEVLAGVGVEVSVDARKRELFALCPNPDHHDQHVGTWSMVCDPGSEMNGLSYCFVCGCSLDVFGVVMQVLGCDFPTAIDSVRGVAVDPLDDEHPADIIYADELYDQEMQPWLPAEIERPAEVGPVTDGSACWRYLHARRFTVDEVRYYGLGDMRDSMRLFVPIMFGGRLVGYVGRTYVDAPKKVKFPPGGASGTWGLIGLDRADRSVRLVSLCDGFADAFRLRRAGKVNPVAACGSTLSEEQAWMLSWVERVDVWADGDVGGERLVRDVVGWLGGGRDVRVAMMAPGTDPDDKDEGLLRTIEPVAYSDHRKRRRQSDGD